MHGDEGACYSLEANVDRFACKGLRPVTPITNFYLTGTDIAAAGITGGLMSGILTARLIEKEITSIIQPGKQKAFLKE